MKLSEFAKNVNGLLKARPESADFDVVFAKDDEGNGFSLVHYSPSIGNYDKEEREFQEEKEVNAVCIN